MSAIAQLNHTGSPKLHVLITTKMKLLNNLNRANITKEIWRYVDQEQKTYMWVQSFSLRCCWGFMSYSMWGCVSGLVVFYLFILKYEGTILLRKVESYYPCKKKSHSTKRGSSKDIHFRDSVLNSDFYIYDRKNLQYLTMKTNNVKVHCTDK
jgi:hypothetical protein